MRLTIFHSVLLAATFVSSSLAVAQAGDYFPLEVGNTWLYRLAGAQPETTFRTVSVEGTETLNGREYFRVVYFGRTLFLRSNADGTIVSFNRQSESEQAWLSLDAAEGTTFEAHIDACTNTGRIESRSVEVTTPVGRFQDTLQARFQGNCADAGVTQQFYAPSIGLVSHEETSIAGPRRYELVYFRTRSANGGGPEVSFTIALDAPRYRAGANMGVRLTLRSTHPDPIALHFPSGQSFDLKLLNQAGDIGYTWSADKLFVLIIRDEQFGPGERSYGFAVPLRDLPPGRYTAQGYLTTAPRQYLGETSFEIIQ